MIKAGYRIIVYSQENDADNRRTVIKDGLSVNEIAFYGQLAKFIKDGKSGIENQFEPSEEKMEIARRRLLPLFQAHNLFSQIELETFEEAEDGIYMMCEYITDLTGGSEHYMIRQIKDVKIEYVPQDTEFPDVTSQFFI